jgi:environmental stress-induced protein Ves
MKIGEPIQLASLSPIPWKNGGGITRNLAVEPEGASFDDFLWRLSFAEVNSSGKFSTFPGVDRTIFLWTGNGMLLKTTSGESFALTHAAGAYAFRGEDEIEATLIDGPTVDFNVMVRRDRCAASVTRYSTEARISRGAGRAFFLCAKGGFRMRFPADQESSLREGESLSVADLTEGVTLFPNSTDASMISVLIDLLDWNPAPR